jgi:Crinkler effector protein N-terminal domain
MSNLESRHWCWILGDEPPSQMTFSVKISPEATVGELKDEIKNYNQVTFDKIDAVTLDLYKITVAEDDMDTDLLNINLDSLKGNKLWSTHKLSWVFPRPPTDGNLHIVIIKLPGECK